MAKAPQPGRCKTRLMPRLSPPQAAALSAAFLRDVTGNLQAASRGASIDAFVAYAPAGTGPLFDGMLAPRHVAHPGERQHPLDPGLACIGFGRMPPARACETMLALKATPSACVLNADSPNLPTSYLRQEAAAILDSRPGDRIVLGPAEDGGYYLLGMKQAHAGLFAGIDWSTPTKSCAQTQATGDAHSAFPSEHAANLGTTWTSRRRSTASWRHSDARTRTYGNYEAPATRRLPLRQTFSRGL